MGHSSVKLASWYISRVNTRSPAIRRRIKQIMIAVSLPNFFRSSQTQAGYKIKLISSEKLNGIKISLPKYRTIDPNTTY
jgi:hypothetical protein